MPRKVLKDTPLPGFFGKLPCTGDFVARGLPTVFRGRWDAWVTRHLAGRLRDGVVWPEAGLRFRLVSGGRVAAGVIVPGRDAAGRVFPLSLMIVGAALPGAADLDAWCDAALSAALPAQNGKADADDLQDALEALSPPNGPRADTSGMVIWTREMPPLTCDPTDPTDALNRALPISCC
ncbi:MAG: type VI secretion system-associated protein TagF [Paracoccaceae bacterium]